MKQNIILQPAKQLSASEFSNFQRSCGCKKSAQEMNSRKKIDLIINVDRRLVYIEPTICKVFTSTTVKNKSVENDTSLTFGAIGVGRDWRVTYI